ncbi:hypothetical protein BSKO_01390 [Bryopsis sp. KO-2023]|nr:hypothetical protein BSKO_01390 [Bryopsis sp. KO-2023]
MHRCALKLRISSSQRECARLRVLALTTSCLHSSLLDIPHLPSTKFPPSILGRFWLIQDSHRASVVTPLGDPSTTHVSFGTRNFAPKQNGKTLTRSVTPLGNRPTKALPDVFVHDHHLAMEDWELIDGPSASWGRLDTSVFLELLTETEQGNPDDLLDPDRDLYVARAPGRLDVMGGIADYSGALVLQMPLAEACFVAVQPHSPGSEPVVRLVSHRESGNGTTEHTWSCPLKDLVSFPDYKAAKAHFAENVWPAYVAGCISVLCMEKSVQFTTGLSIVVWSEVPEGAGVSSSAAVEVSSMMAIAGAVGVKLEGRELALLCQKVENYVVGAPCGVMDQMASAMGKEGHLLALLCQPAEFQGYVPIPKYMQFCAIDSGEKHCVGGSDYSCVRVASFMGKKILAGMIGQDPQHLARISPSRYKQDFQENLPDEMTGIDFIHKYRDHGDNVTSVDPRASYRIKVATSHPVYDHFRAIAFREILGARKSGSQMGVLGELMFQSHASYKTLGITSEGTDLLVDLIHESMAAGGRPNLFGGKITGGGSGGAVCLLISSEGEDAVENIAKEYAKKTKRKDIPKLFFGSSDGAVTFGCLRIRRAVGIK